jgi:hypothetical protein
MAASGGNRSTLITSTPVCVGPNLSNEWLDVCADNICVNTHLACHWEPHIAIPASLAPPLIQVDGNVLQTGVLAALQGRPLPQEVAAAAGHIIDVAATDRCALALTDAGRVLAWGLSWASCRRGMPGELSSGRIKATHIAAAQENMLAIVAGGRVLQWGELGSTGVPTTANSSVTAISASGKYSLAIRGGALMAWGTLPCGGAVPQEAKAAGAVCWASAGADNAIVRLCNGAVPQMLCLCSRGYCVPFAHIVDTGPAPHSIGSLIAGWADASIAMSLGVPASLSAI